jgi:hypothetical protein
VCPGVINSRKGGFNICGQGLANNVSIKATQIIPYGFEKLVVRHG